MSVKHSGRLQDRMGKYTSSDNGALQSQDQCQRANHADQGDKLLEKGVIKIAQPSSIDQFVGFLFLRLKKEDGSMWPVFNLKSQNQFISYQHFKIGGIHMAVEVITQGDWFAKLD